MVAAQVAVATKWFQKEPSLAELDKRFQEFATTIARFQTDPPPFRDQDAIRLRLESFALAARQNARIWIECYGKLLHDSALGALQGFKNEIGERVEKLKLKPTTLEELKFVLAVIADIREMSIQFETRLLDIHERYELLQAYGIPVDMAELEGAHAMRLDIDALVLASKNVDAGLTVIKKKFTQITQEQVQTFSAKLLALLERFRNEGPSSCGSDLDKALVTLQQFKQELAVYETQRQELASAEKLFDLPPSGYSELIAVQKEIRALDLVFAIYDEQKKAREGWSETLWANLNVQVLTDGIDGTQLSMQIYANHVNVV